MTKTRSVTAPNQGIVALSFVVGSLARRCTDQKVNDSEFWDSLCSSLQGSGAPSSGDSLGCAPRGNDIILLQPGEVASDS